MCDIWMQDREKIRLMLSRADYSEETISISCERGRRNTNEIIFSSMTASAFMAITNGILRMSAWWLTIPSSYQKQRMRLLCQVDQITFYKQYAKRWHKQATSWTKPTLNIGS